MQHNEATVKVYFTRDYGVFKSILGNRDLSQTKINRLINDIENGLDMLKYYPILVDRDMNVIDGQHRLYVARKIKSNIWYMISEPVELNDIAKINSNTEKWKYKDFLNCYVVKGVEDYIVLEGFLKENPIGIGTAAKLLMAGSVNSGNKNERASHAFQRGEFKVNYLQESIAIMAVVNLFESHKNFRTRSFISAIERMVKAGKCDVDVLVEKFEEKPEALDRCANAKDYMSALEHIYNYRSQTRKYIF
jgi:hypothetical protein